MVPFAAYPLSASSRVGVAVATSSHQSSPVLLFHVYPQDPDGFDSSTSKTIPAAFGKNDE